MTRNFKGLLLLLFAQVACNPIAPAMSPTPPQAPQTSAATVASPTEVTIDQPTTTPEKVVNTSVAPAETPVKVLFPYDIGQDKMLFLRIREHPGYTLLNLKDNIATNFSSSDECYFDLLPHSTNVLCKGPKNLSTLDILNGATQEIPLQLPDWLDSSPNGRYMYFIYRLAESGFAEIQLYDVIAQEKKTFAVEAEIGDLIEPPVLSHDGQHLAFVQHTPQSSNTVLFLLSLGLTQKVNVAVGELEIAPDMAWSPKALRLAFGATDAPTEIGFAINQIALFDVSTGEAQLLSKAPQGKFYNSFGGRQIWSPDGARLAIPMSNQLCIIAIDARLQECFPAADPQSRINLFEWSPSGRYIAYVSVAEGDSSNSDLSVYNVENKTFVTILSDTGLIDGLYWR